MLAGSTDVSPADRRDTLRGTAHHQQCFCGDVGSAFGVEAGEGVVRQGNVEGVPVEVLLDTGSARTLVRKELVPEGKVLGGRQLLSVARTVEVFTTRWQNLRSQLEEGLWLYKQPCRGGYQSSCC